jgi:arylsulfatase A-like enzyme
MSKISRRSFLKMVGAAAPAIFFPKTASWADQNVRLADASKPNVIILLFDAMSARNLSLYGYPRATSPNLERFAEHSTVYHSHYAGGNFTIPGVASLLTGTYPWTNRAINHSGVVKKSMTQENIFRATGNGYHRMSFPQSVWSNFIVTQFADDVDTLLTSETFGKLDYLKSEYFPNDANMATRALDDFVFKEYEEASLLFGTMQSALLSKNSNQLATYGYPRGLPHNMNYPLYFKLEDVLGGVASLLPTMPSPFFSYVHFFSPHAPYRPTNKFNGNFIDQWNPIEKPDHRFSEHTPANKLAGSRRAYDEFIASVDFELGKLLDSIEKEGMFENSYVIITADHGEMFERGEKAHSTPLLYDPVIHIPLIISAPGQKTRRNVYSPTNAVDILPTVMNLTGNPIPAWAEGKPLPELGGAEDYERSTFTVEAKRNSSFAPLEMATIAMRQGAYKLIHYIGYEAEDTFELYDLESDLEELKDLYPAQPAILKKMKAELLDMLLDSNKPYLK